MNCVNINDLPKMMRPNEQGVYGVYGGSVDHPVLAAEMEKIKAAFYSIIGDADFIDGVKGQGPAEADPLSAGGEQGGGGQH